MQKQRTTRRAPARPTLRISTVSRPDAAAAAIPADAHLAFFPVRATTPPDPLRRLVGAVGPDGLSTTTVPVGVAAILAHATNQPVAWPLVIACLLAFAALRLAVLYRLDADVHEDLCTLGRARRTAARASVRALAVAGVAFVPIVLVTGWVGMIVATATAGAAYAYVGGLLPDRARALLDPFAAVGSALAVVVAATAAFGAEMTPPAILAGLQLGMLALVPVLVCALRDEPSDRAACRATPATLFGRDRTRTIAFAAVGLAFGGAVGWVLLGQWAAALLPLVTGPSAIALRHGLRTRSRGPIVNVLLRPTTRFRFAFGAALLLGLLIA